ncbi:MAG: LD-carboxypeptidase [Agathobacter sp.]|nr:LD-carboxypeptidase [Agathobacter sp.]
MKKVGIVCCSNGQRRANENDIEILKSTLQNIGLEALFSDYIYEKDGISCGSAKERAQALVDFYVKDEISEIFDISGGDLANGVLPYLDYDMIAKSEKKFWGYSDLTTVLNAIYAKTGNASVLYQVRNLVYQHRRQQLADFTNTVIENGGDLYQIDYRFAQGNKMQGVVVGGNIRCFLKLAGTEYMPDLTDKILLLESYSGTVSKMETYLCQLQQLGAFDKAAGILLGTFTEMEEKECVPSMVELVQRMVGKNMPIAVTKDIGHGTDAKAIVIGKEYSF